MARVRRVRGNFVQPVRNPPYPLPRTPHSAADPDPAMNFEILIPIVLFLAIAYTIKAVVDAGVRRKMVDANGSQDLVRSMLESEDIRRRHGSLRWGIVLIALAVGFGIVQGAGWDELNPGVIAVLLGATGIGNLAYYLLARKLG